MGLGLKPVRQTSREKSGAASLGASLLLFYGGHEKNRVWAFFTRIASAPDGVDGICLYFSKTKSFKLFSQLVPTETMVHDPIGVILMKRSVFFIKIGQGEEAAWFQALEEFAQNPVDIGEMMQGHGRENELEILRAVVVMQVEQAGQDIFNPLFVDFLSKGLQHSGRRIGRDQRSESGGKLKADKAGAAAVFHGLHIRAQRQHGDAPGYGCCKFDSPVFLVPVAGGGVKSILAHGYSSVKD